MNMAHLNPASVTALQSHNASGAPGSTYSHAQGVNTPSVNLGDEQQPDWHPYTSHEYRSYDHIIRRVPPPTYPCYWHRWEERNPNHALEGPSSPEAYNPWLYLDPEPASKHRSKWNKSHLLSLPKEIRLQIYKYVLTDPSVPDMVVGISREPFSPCYKLTRPPTPRVTATLENRRNAPISINVLLASQQIYKEALPVLYSSVKFAPWDLEGILPLFLDTLSPFAQSHVQNIKLYVPDAVQVAELTNNRSAPYFHWAVTCAQVAKLNDSIRHVQIEGSWSVFEQESSSRRGILYPLCKIKAVKHFSPEHNDQFQRLLIEAEEELKAKAKIREEKTKAEAEERARRNEIAMETERGQRPAAAGVIGGVRNAIQSGGSYSMEEWRVFAEENIKRIDEELNLIPGIKQFEKELEEHKDSSPEYDDPDSDDWDLVSTRSGALTPKARSESVMSRDSEDSWTDTASTIIVTEEVDIRDDNDSDGEIWEHVDK